MSATMDERNAYIALNAMQKIGPVSVRSWVQHLWSAACLFDADPSMLRSTPDVSANVVEAFLEQRGKVSPEDEVDKAEGVGAHIVTQVDSEYPPFLKTIHDPPLALYVQGHLTLADQQAIGVVGTRHPTHYGTAVAERLSSQLSQSGFTIVSGLALGIDTAAHRAAIATKGRTLAVLGGALNCLYPESNRDLAVSIAKQGAVISEFPMGRAPDRTTFPMRNRIISGLSKGVIVVEADHKSGAMISARMAMTQGRTVFAVPGRIDNPRSAGCHALIRDGAVLVTDAADIFEEFSFLIPRRESTEASSPRLSEVDQRVFELIPVGDERDIDSLIRESGLGASEVQVALLSLEMRRLIRMLPGRQVTRT